MNMKTFSLHITLAEEQTARCMGQIPANDMAALDVCMLACVTLLCGLQASTGSPIFNLRCKSPFGYESTVGYLVDHVEGWIDEGGKPLNLEAL